MKKFTKFMLLGIVFMTSISKASAQDVIVLNNDYFDELRVKVVEVSESEVKYKKWSYQDGPTFSVSTDKILYIKYQNGEKERFDGQKESAKPAEKESLIPEKSNLLFKESATEQTAALPEAAKAEEVDEKYFPRRKGSWQSSASIRYVIPDGEFDESFFLGIEWSGRCNVANGLNVYVGLGETTGYIAVGSGQYRTSTSETSLTLPLGIGYNLPLGSLCSLDFNTGPRLNYIVAGSISQGTEEVKYKDLEDEYGMKVERFNAGWDIGAALMFANYGVKFEYSAGISDSAGDYFKIGFHMIF